MAVTTGPRFGLTRWSAPTDPFRRTQLDNDHALLEAMAALVDQGIFNDRPAAGTGKAFYFATDVGTAGALYYDDGSAWSPALVYTNDDRLAGRMLRTQGGAEAVAAGTGTTGTVTLDAEAASVFTISPTGNVTLNPTNVPAAGNACTLTVIVAQDATARAVTMPAGTAWLGSAPTQVASKRCVITMLTTDGGATWLASGAVET